MTSTLPAGACFYWVSKRSAFVFHVDLLAHAYAMALCMMNYNSHYEPELISLIDLFMLQMGIRIEVKKADGEDALSHTDHRK